MQVETSTLALKRECWFEESEDLISVFHSARYRFIASDCRRFVRR